MSNLIYPVRSELVFDALHVALVRVAERMEKQQQKCAQEKKEQKEWKLQE